MALRDCLNRRSFTGMLLAAVAAAAPTARAQLRNGTARIGFLGSEPWRPIEGLEDGLRAAGYSGERKAHVEYKWFRGASEKIPDLTAELIAITPHVIVTVGTPATLAVKRATSTIPIVMGLVGDPVGSGFVSSLSRPGGNITGVSVLAAELEWKRVELLKEIVPGLARLAVLANSGNPYSAVAIKHAQRAAESLRVALEPVPTRNLGDLEAALGAIGRMRPDAVLVVADQFLLSQRARIAEFLIGNAIPSAYTYREHVESGGLFSYATNYYESFRRAAGYIDKILKGAKPAELPVEQVDRFEFVFNLKAAKALRLSVSDVLLARADVVLD